MSRGLLHCLFNAENPKGSVFGLIELWANASLDNSRYQLGLIRHHSNILRGLLKTLSQGLVRRSLSPLMCISDFWPTHTLRATGYTYTGYISRQRINCTNKKYSQKSARGRGGAPPRKRSGIKLGRQWLAPYMAFPALSWLNSLNLLKDRGSLRHLGR